MDAQQALEDLIVNNRDLERLEDLLAEFNIFNVLGIELNDEAVKHYPPVSFGRAPVINRDGSLRDY